MRAGGASRRAASLPRRTPSDKIHGMSLTRAEILHVALLARLELDDAEVEILGRQLQEVLDYMASLRELPTDDVAPTTHVEAGGTPPREDEAGGTPLREDETGRCLPREEVLRGAPGADGVFFKVPRVVQR